MSAVDVVVPQPRGELAVRHRPHAAALQQGGARHAARARPRAARHAAQHVHA